MKKSIWAFFLMTMCSTFLFSVAIGSTNNVDDDLQDRIALGRLGGTTRAASVNRSTSVDSKVEVEVEVEASNLRSMVSISVQNYRGGAWVEVLGQKEVRQHYFEVHDMGFNVVNISGLRTGEFTIRVTLGSEIFAGTLKKELYGH